MYSTAIRRHAYIPSDNLPYNRTQPHKQTTAHCIITVKI